MDLYLYLLYRYRVTGLLMLYNLSHAQQLFGDIQHHKLPSLDEGELSYLQQDLNRPGTFLAIQGSKIIEFDMNSDSGPRDFIPHFEFKDPTAILQLPDSILVVDGLLHCIVEVSNNSLFSRTHSGTCDTKVGKMVDGSFMEAKYEHPFDLASVNINDTYIYVTDWYSLRLINQSKQILDTLYRSEMLLGRIGFLCDNILLGGSKGILILRRSNYTKLELIQLRVTTIRHTRSGTTTTTSPYRMKSFVIISKNHILVSCEKNDMSENEQRFVLINIQNKKSMTVCSTVSLSQQRFCGNKTITPGYAVMQNDTLFITEPKHSRHSSSLVVDSNSHASKSTKFISIVVKRFCSNGQHIGSSIGDSKAHMRRKILQTCHLDMTTLELGIAPFPAQIAEWVCPSSHSTPTIVGLKDPVFSSAISKASSVTIYQRQTTEFYSNDQEDWKEPKTPQYLHTHFVVPIAAIFLTSAAIFSLIMRIYYARKTDNHHIRTPSNDVDKAVRSEDEEPQCNHECADDMCLDISEATTDEDVYCTICDDICENLPPTDGQPIDQRELSNQSHGILPINSPEKCEGGEGIVYVLNTESEILNAESETTEL